MAKYKITLETPYGVKKMTCSDDQYILEAAEDEGVDLPYSCRAGSCSSCVGKIIVGRVDQCDVSFLSEGEKQQGFVSLCCAYPQSDCKIKTHQEEFLSSENNAYTASSIDMFNHFLDDSGESKTLDQLGLTEQVSQLVKQNGALGKSDNHSLQGDFISQILQGETSFKNSYKLQSVISNPHSGLWALGGVIISGEFNGGASEKNGKYFLSGAIDYTLNDKFTDPYDTFNLVKTDINIGGKPYNISGGWSENIHIEISKEDYERLK